MTKHEKLISKIRNNPTDVNFETLQSYCLNMVSRKDNQKVVQVIIHTPVEIPLSPSPATSQ